MAELANAKITDILKYVRKTGRFEGDIFKESKTHIFKIRTNTGDTNTTVN